MSSNSTSLEQYRKVATWVVKPTTFLFFFYDNFNTIYVYRNDKRWSAAPGGAWLPHAVPSRMPHRSVWHNAGMLAQGPHEAANIRDPAVETGGLLHHGRLRVQRGVGLLRTRPPSWMANLNSASPPPSSFPPHVSWKVSSPSWLYHTLSSSRSGHQVFSFCLDHQ